MRMVLIFSFNSGYFPKCLPCLVWWMTYSWNPSVYVVQFILRIRSDRCLFVRPQACWNNAHSSCAILFVSFHHILNFVCLFVTSVPASCLISSECDETECCPQWRLLDFHFLGFTTKSPGSHTGIYMLDSKKHTSAVGFQKFENQHSPPQFKRSHANTFGAVTHWMCVFECVWVVAHVGEAD